MFPENSRVPSMAVMWDQVGTEVTEGVEALVGVCRFCLRSQESHCGYKQGDALRNQPERDPGLGWPVTEDLVVVATSRAWPGLASACPGLGCGQGSRPAVSR